MIKFYIYIYYHHHHHQLLLSSAFLRPLLIHACIGWAAYVWINFIKPVHLLPP